MEGEPSPFMHCIICLHVNTNWKHKMKYAIKNMIIINTKTFKLIIILFLVILVNVHPFILLLCNVFNILVQPFKVINRAGENYNIYNKGQWYKNHDTNTKRPPGKSRTRHSTNIQSVIICDVLMLLFFVYKKLVPTWL